MPVNKNEIENSNETNFLKIKIIILGVLSTFSIVGGLYCCFTTNNQPPEEPIQEVIKEESDNQETEKQEKQEQEEVIVHDEYIPVIDNLWLNIPIFVIVMIVGVIITVFGFFGGSWGIKVFGFEPFENPKNSGKLVWTKAIIFFILTHQVIVYIIWFILMLFFAGLSKIWDKEHSWWSNVVKGFFRNRIHRGWWSLIPILLLIIGLIFFIFMTKD